MWDGLFAGSKVEEVDSVDRGEFYEFDIVAIVKVEGAYWVTSSSGCSCVSEREAAMIDDGPFQTYEEALKYIPETHRAYFKDIE
jgi:hypothetical protein